MKTIARYASLALKLYCALFLALVVIGLSGERLPVWPYLVILSTDVAVTVLRIPVVGALLGAYLLLWLVLWRSPVRAKPVVGSIFLAAVVFWLHYVATVGLVAGPRQVAIMACVLLAIALVRPRALVRLVRAPALPMASIVFLPLGVVGFLAVTMALDPGEKPGRKTSPHRLAPFRHLYDVAVLGASGKIAVMSGSDYTLYRLDGRSGEIEASIPFPEGLRPQRAVFHEETERLFVIGHDFGDREEVAVAVVATADWTVERWLPMEGCHNAIQIEMWEEEVISLCEPEPLVFFYDRGAPENGRAERIPTQGLYTGHELEVWGNRLQVSSAPWPFIYRREPGQPTHWTRHRLSSMAIGLATNPATGRMYASFPLERRVGVLADDSFEPVSSLRTEGMPRDLAIDPDEGWLFTGSYFVGVVEWFDLATGERLGAWKVGSLVRGVAWDPAAHRVYAASVDGVYAIDVR